MFSNTKKILKRAKKEVILKVITSLFIQGLALVIPVFWSKTITEVTDAIYKVGYYLIIITLLLSNTGPCLHTCLYPPSTASTAHPKHTPSPHPIFSSNDI